MYAEEKNGIPTITTNLFKIYYSKDFRYNDFITELQNSCKIVMESKTEQEVIEKLNSL